MSQISKPINSEQVPFSGQVLDDSELAAVSGGVMSAADNVIKSIGEGLRSTAQKG